MMTVQHLIQMANGVGHFYATESRRDEAIAGIARHMQRFWDPRMRQKIVLYLQSGGDGLDELVLEAVAALSHGGVD